MKKNIDDLFSELIQMIPELQKDEADWREFIKKFVEARPNSQLDADFKKDLHHEILKKTTHMKTHSKKEPTKKDNLIGKLMFTFLSGGILTALFVLPTLQNSKKTSKTPLISEITEVAFANNLINITKNSEKNAFGILKVEKQNNSNAEQAVGGVAKMANAPAIMSSRMIMPPYGGQINYEYLYEGSDLPEIEKSITIYKKQKGGLNLPQFQDQLDKFGINLVDLETFKELSLDNVSFTEETELGYQISVNFKDGSVSIHQDYEKWQKQLCPNKPYCRQKPIKKEEIPSDKKLIKIAQNFLQTHKITNTNLGTPIVKKYWEENAHDGEETTYYPNSIPVIYPFVVNGQEISSQWGEPVGIQININIRLKKVESANFSNLNLESSDYESSNAEEVLERAKEGGAQGVKYNNPEQVVKIKLGTPKKTLTQMYLPNKDSEREEIFVPAFIFPVINKDKEIEQYYRQKEIIVPLAKDLFTLNASNDFPKIQPLLRNAEMEVFPMVQ